MIELKFSATCLTCPYMNVIHDMQIFYTDSTPSTVAGYISCEHRDVCKLYDKKEEVMKPIEKEYTFVQEDNKD